MTTEKADDYPRGDVAMSGQEVMLDDYDCLPYIHVLYSALFYLHPFGTFWIWEGLQQPSSSFLDWIFCQFSWPLGIDGPCPVEHLLLVRRSSSQPMSARPEQRERARAVPRRGRARPSSCTRSQWVGQLGGCGGHRGEAGRGQHGSLLTAPRSRLRPLVLEPPAAAGSRQLCSGSVASKTPVGFIGLGNMGNPMAKNLMKHGYPLIIYDVFPDACKEFQDAGEQVVSSPADVAEKADRIITMLPTSMNAIEAYSGANGILKKVKKGSLLIDSSTIDPAVSKELAKEVEKMGAVFMDAPVSG
ncbi:uncharacterized protein LOC103256177, partial [Carlito syrichta]|uniref:3-hydroxyisobutyrate dehydrogenase n=1 Tax=Carlito syrichta TaxID=1868482 RepID=A0A3Q0DWL5_CARSF